MSVKINKSDFDNHQENASTVSVEGNFTDIKPIIRPVVMLFGYNLQNCIQKTINSEKELRDAIYDSYAICEERRLSAINERQKKHAPKSSKWYWLEKQKQRGWSEFNILIKDRNSNVFIRDKKGNWRTWGWSEPLTIDFKTLYENILITAEHCRQISVFCGHLIDSI